MWLVFGAIAVISAVLNLVFCFKGKDPKWFRFISLSFTALTVCAFYSAEAARVVNEDWSGLMDIMPSMSRSLWGYVITSILVNGISLLYHRKH